MEASTLEVEWVPATSLRLNPANPRRNEAAVPHVAASLARFGWRQPIVARPSGEIVAGHTRLLAARSLGMERVPVVRFEGTDLDATAYAIADNRTHEFAEWDEPALAKLLEGLRAEDALEGVGFSTEEIDDLLAELAHDASKADLEDAGAEEPPETPVTQLGDLWLLGDHRILCGDSTSEDDLARLMDGKRASLLATDPPYLVDYKGGNHPQSWANRPETRDKHWDDYVDPTQGLAFFQTLLERSLAHCIERVPVYQWHAHRRQALVEEAWKAAGLLVHQQLIWVKARSVLTRSHYMWQHEPCFYGWPEGKMPEKAARPAPNLTTVWEIDQVGQQDGIHPTQKPLRIFEIPIEQHTKPGAIVLEPFSGSGTQIIGAERLGRKCFAMELSPAFVDVAVRRWEKTTGREAVLDGSGKTFAQVAAERGVA